LSSIKFTLDVPVQVANDAIDGPGFCGTLTTSANALERVVGSVAFVFEDLGVSANATTMTMANGAGTEIVSRVFDVPVLWSAPQIYKSTFTGPAEALLGPCWQT